MTFGRAALLGAALFVPACGDGATEDAAGTFSVSAAVSEAIPTVGIVEWSTSRSGISAASIDFGLDLHYGSSAPVDLGAPNHRTLLVGMKPSRTYHFRIVAEGASGTERSRDYTLTTGGVPSGLPRVSLTRSKPESATGGFLLSGFLATGPVFILDADGDYVWWYGSGEVGRASLSVDKRHVWFAGINVAGGAPSIRRVTWDGFTEEDFTPQFGDIHHDFAVLPDETVATIEHTGETDRIVERAPDGTRREILDMASAFGGALRNHTNSIQYSRDEDAYTVSDLLQNGFVKVTRGGEVLWVLGGTSSDFSGPDTEWEHQHGHHALAPDRLLFFSNGGAGQPSRAIELALDLESMTARRTWEYSAGIHTLLYGDVRRLENGNTLVSFSSSGVIHEVDSTGELVETLVWELGGALGYTTKLATLYPTPG